MQLFFSYENQIVINGTRDINHRTFTRSLFHNHYIWPPMFYLSIHLNTEIPQNFHNVIFNDRLNFMFVLPFNILCCRQQAFRFPFQTFRFPFLTQCYGFSDFLLPVSLPNCSCSFMLLSLSICSSSILLLQLLLLSILSFPNFLTLSHFSGILPHYS